MTRQMGPDGVEGRRWKGAHGAGEKPLQAGAGAQRKANLPGIRKAEAEVLTGPETGGL